MNYLFGWAIKDGTLGPDVGRLIVYKKHGLKSNGPSRDHNDLLRAFAAAYQMNKDDVISNASRFYWKYQNKENIIISPVRKIDEDWAYSHKQEFVNILNEVYVMRNGARI
jgi:hypothetical protein